MNNISLSPNASFEILHTSASSPTRIPREQAFGLLRDLFAQLDQQGLAGSFYLTFGSTARELLDPRGAESFGDLDILTIVPLEKAIVEIGQTLKSMGIDHEAADDGHFFLYVNGDCFQLQLVDPAYSKKAFPGGFIRFEQSAFDAERVEWIEQDGGSRIPCVPLAFLDTWGKSFYFRGDAKMDPLMVTEGAKVSAFEP